MTPEAFVDTLRALARRDAVSLEQQGALSDLRGNALRAFEQAWPRLSAGERLAAIEELANLAEENVRLELGPLFRASLLDEESEVRAAAMRANVHDESGAFLDALLGALQGDPAAGARLAAAEALGPFALRAELEELQEATADRIATALRDRAEDPTEEYGVRGAALASVGYFSRPEVLATVLEALKEPRLEQAAVRALGRSADARWIDRLVEYSQRPEATMRAEAATALGEIEDEAAVPRLVELVDDPVGEVRLAAVTALGAIGGDQARETLVYAAEADDPALAAAARAALEALDALEDFGGL
jgi:HEAT repeat protein